MKRSFRKFFKELGGCERLALAALTVLSLVKLWRLDGGLVLGEPDEFIHWEVAQNFSTGWVPRTSGGVWFFQLPLYPFLGWLASLLVGGKYLGLRVVSVAASWLLTFGTFFYLRFKFRDAGEKLLQNWGPAVGALLMTISPMVVYYSRLGLLGMACVSFGMLFLYTFDAAREKDSLRWAVVAGLFLALALLVKYTALIYCLVAGIYWLVEVVRKNWRKDWKKAASFDLEAKTTLVLVILLALTVPVAWILRRQNPYFFKLQTFTSLGFVRDFWRVRGGELTLGYYLKDIGWWLTWPVVVGFLAGLSYFVKRRRDYQVLGLGFLLTALFIIPHTPFYPRYFFPLVPFIVIVAAVGVLSLAGWGRKFVRRIVRSDTMIRIVVSGVVLAFVGGMVPTAWEAFEATDHRLIEDAAFYIRGHSREVDPWIFANYWPNYFGEAAGSSRATWLADSAWEASAYIPGIEKSPLEILGTEGGWVVLEGRYAYSPIFITPESRTKAWQFIRARYEPVAEILDRAPNFPHFRGNQNEVVIYHIK